MTTETLVQQAVDQVRTGQLAEGLATFRLILEQEPDNVAALSGCAVGESLSGNHNAAIRLFKQAHTCAPGDSKILANLGHACMAAGRTDEARGAFEEAHRINDQDAEPCYWLGYLAEQSGDGERAEGHYRRALERNSAHREASLQLANVLFVRGSKPEALTILRNAEARLPHDRDITYVRGRLASNAIPGWHLPMLADPVRNDAFQNAIAAKVKPGDIVLDIGTGSGLLAMMAARAGAAHVYACEVDEILASLAREVIALNGFADSITVLGKHSSALIVGEDLPRRADVLVTETFDSAVVGEGAVPTIRHAWKTLLAAGARIIPEGATLHGALTACPHLQCFRRIGTVNGFDFAPMNALTHPFGHKDALIYLETSEDCRVLSEPFPIHHFDFRSAPDIAFASECRVPIVDSGDADSVLIWFDLHLAPGVAYSTRHSKAQHHWRLAVQPLMDVSACRAGETATIKTRFESYFDFAIEV